MRPASLRFAYCLGDRSEALLVRRPRAGGHRPALGHRPGAARRRLVAGALLRGHGRPRRQQLPDRDRRPGSRSERARFVDEHPRSRHAEARGVDDARDLLDVELRRGQNVQLPTREQQRFMVYDAILERGPRACLLRRAEPEVLGRSMPQAAGTGRTGSACSSRSCARSRRQARSPRRSGTRGRRASSQPPIARSERFHAVAATASSG